MTPKELPGRPARAVIATLGLLYLCAVLWVTLRPLPWATEGNQEPYGILNPRAWIGSSTWLSGSPLEVAANVAMFLPLGLVAGLLFRGAARVIIPVAVTVAIELAQIPLGDRISHPRDLVANASGAVLGLMIAVLVVSRRSARA
ncbi:MULTISPECIES: VanZ family protein [Bacteria]